MENNIFKLNLESDAFGALKTDFDQLLRRILAKMEKHESEEAEMTIKLNISLRKEQIDDFSGTYAGAQRDIVVPAFKHKITTMMKLKDEKSGYLGGDYELVWDADTADYIIRPIGSNQVSYYDDEVEMPQLNAATLEADFRELDDSGDDVLDEYESQFED